MKKQAKNTRSRNGSGGVAIGGAASIGGSQGNSAGGPGLGGVRFPSNAVTFPNTKRFVLRYGQVFSIVTTTTVGTQVFNLNGAFDPDFTGTGAQPRYYDTLLGASASAAPYRSYRVLGCRYIVRAATAASNTTAHLAVRVRNGGSDMTTQAQFWEVPYGRDVLLTGAGGLGGVVTFHDTVAIAPRASLPKNDPSLSALYSANPTTLIQLEIAQIAADNSTSLTVQYYAEFLYDIECFDLNEVSASLQKPVPTPAGPPSPARWPEFTCSLCGADEPLPAVSATRENRGVLVNNNWVCGCCLASITPPRK